MGTKKKIQSTKYKVQNTAVFPFDAILDWYQKNGRHDLPWRQVYKKPIKERLYKVWIAEVMLQQTQVDRVTGYYVKFLEKYPTIESLAATTYDELFPYYQGLGYYGRARRMIELAKVVVEKYNGIFPDDFEKLRKLPGVGKYTAQALLAFGYDIPVLAMDANLVKIFSRYFYGDKNIFGMKNEKGRMKNDGFVPSSSDERNHCAEGLSEDPGIQANNLPQSGSFNSSGLDSTSRSQARLAGMTDSGQDFDTLVSHLEEQLQKENISGREINNALMDFGALVSTSWDKIDRENYPLRDCLWFTSEGTKEPIKKKIIRLSEKGAKLVVFLHEAHKSYWSSVNSHYEPFLIEPTSSDDRRTVQDYFSATFGLEVSVRPSFGSGYLIEKNSLNVYDSKQKQVFRGATVGASGIQREKCGSEERVLAPLNSFGTFGNKSTNEPGLPVKLFHAQIQTGSLKQKTFSKSEKEEWVRKHIILSN